MTYCEIAKRNCSEMREQEDYTLDFGVFTSRAIAHSGAVKLCKKGADSNEGVISEGQCGLILFDVNVEGAQNA